VNTVTLAAGLELSVTRQEARAPYARCSSSFLPTEQNCLVADVTADVVGHGRGCGGFQNGDVDYSDISAYEDNSFWNHIR
jgi:hypothetical protein